MEIKKYCRYNPPSGAYLLVPIQCTITILVVAVYQTSLNELILSPIGKYCEDQCLMDIKSMETHRLTESLEHVLRLRRIPPTAAQICHISIGQSHRLIRSPPFSKISLCRSQLPLPLHFLLSSRSPPMALRFRSSRCEPAPLYGLFLFVYCTFIIISTHFVLFGACGTHTCSSHRPQNNIPLPDSCFVAVRVVRVIVFSCHGRLFFSMSCKSTMQSCLRTELSWADSV